MVAGSTPAPPKTWRERTRRGPVAKRPEATTLATGQSNMKQTPSYLDEMAALERRSPGVIEEPNLQSVDDLLHGHGNSGTKRPNEKWRKWRKSTPPREDAGDWAHGDERRR